MKKYSWHEGCPISIEQLRLLQLSHLGYDNKIHQGELVVHQDVAEETLEIFKTLFSEGFQIEKMKLVDEYKGNDEESMNANNTSAFNCRVVTGKQNVFSKHSYGRAIDINPLTNPYVKGNLVLPKAGKKYRDRSQKQKGMILKNDSSYQAFTQKNWIWGGNWNSLKDYQHFEKE